jgi:hypothetical protein
MVTDPHLGSATMHKNGQSYDVDIYLSEKDCAPVITCHKTGKYYLLPWTDILILADVAGLLNVDK